MTYVRWTGPTGWKWPAGHSSPSPGLQQNKMCTCRTSYSNMKSICCTAVGTGGAWQPHHDQHRPGALWGHPWKIPDSCGAGGSAPGGEDGPERWDFGTSTPGPCPHWQHLQGQRSQAGWKSHRLRNTFTLMCHALVNVSLKSSVRLVRLGTRHKISSPQQFMDF